MTPYKQALGGAALQYDCLEVRRKTNKQREEEPEFKMNY